MAFPSVLRRSRCAFLSGSPVTPFTTVPSTLHLSSGLTFVLTGSAIGAGFSWATAEMETNRTAQIEKAFTKTSLLGNYVAFYGRIFRLPLRLPFARHVQRSKPHLHPDALGQTR